MKFSKIRLCDENLYSLSEYKNCERYRERKNDIILKGEGKETNKQTIRMRTTVLVCRTIESQIIFGKKKKFNFLRRKLSIYYVTVVLKQTNKQT